MIHLNSVVSSDPDSVEQVRLIRQTGNFIEECLLIELFISIDKRINSTI